MTKIFYSECLDCHIFKGIQGEEDGFNGSPSAITGLRHTLSPHLPVSLLINALYISLVITYSKKSKPPFYGTALLKFKVSRHLVHVLIQVSLFSWPTLTHFIPIKMQERDSFPHVLTSTSPTPTPEKAWCVFSAGRKNKSRCHVEVLVFITGSARGQR